MPRAITLITMSPKARRAFARDFFLAGFQLSGYGLHGERVDLNRSNPNPVRDLLLTEFERVYEERAAALEALVMKQGPT